MSKQSQPLPVPLAMLSLALLFSLFWLSACGTGTDSSTQATPTALNTAASDTIVKNMTTPEAELTVTTGPDAAGGSDCANVNQIPSAECIALVALYDGTNGPDWVDNSGWLVSDTPCTWSGIDCTDGHVSYISLLYNQLTGSLPPEIGNLSHLRVLELWNNRLRGPIPAELGDLSELVSLDMSVNQFTGPLPAELGHLGNLQSLSLAHNQISGAIPSTLGKMADLESLDLSNNQFSDPIPLELGDLVNLYALRLSHNQLSGTIPDTFGSLSKLSELDLSYNRLRGPVPEPIIHIDQRMLWGNQLDGTITANGQAPFTVDYLGVRFSADPSLATSIWPEVKPATPVPEDLDGPSYWLATPEHIRFTFADPRLPLSRRRMGFSLAAEAQILIFPLAELAEINPLVQTQVETLQNLLAERGTVPSGELPLLPLTNSAQVFHAQAQYLVFGNIQGLRFISQHSQDSHPIMLSQELFYTFQGFTDDGTYYVAAFFPLTTAVLPDTIEVEDWDAFHANYDTYLSETTAVLDQLPPIEFTPDLTLLDAVITSLRLGPDGALSGAETAPSSLPLAVPPAGLVYRSSTGIWQIGSSGEPQLLTERVNALPAPDAAHAVYMDEQRRLWLINLADGHERQLAAGVDLSWLYQWGDAHTLLLGVWLSPAESEGAATGHVATLDINTGELRVIEEQYLSLGRSSLAPDGETVAYDISPFYSDVVPNGQVYHPDNGSQPVDPALFAGLGEERPWHLYNPAWSPDGTRLAWLWAAETDARLVVFDLTRQTATTVFTWQPAQFGALPPSPLWSPDGQWLAIEVWANNDAESGLWLLAADGSHARRISATGSSFAAGSGPVWLSSHTLVYIECDENYSNCENRLFDLVSEMTALLDLPSEGTVLLAPFTDTSEGE